MSLCSYCCFRTEACSLSGAKDSIDDLALNQGAKKRNVLRRLQEVDQAAACTEEADRRLTCRHRSGLRRRVGYLNLLAAEELTDYVHFELERQRQAGHRFTCFYDTAHDR